MKLTDDMNDAIARGLAFEELQTKRRRCEALTVDEIDWLINYIERLTRNLQNH